MDTSTWLLTPGIEDELVADQYAPFPDVIQTRHLVVAADVPTTYAAVRKLDFADVHGGLIDAALWGRGLPERRKKRRGEAVPTATRLRFDDMATGSGWVLLGECPGVEIAADATSRLFGHAVDWREVEPEHFASFDDVGNGKVVLSLSVRPYGSLHSLLSYDIRVVLTDPGSQSRFRIYWAVVSPFVKMIQDATLRSVARRAERAAAMPTTEQA